MAFFSTSSTCVPRSSSTVCGVFSACGCVESCGRAGCRSGASCCCCALANVASANRERMRSASRFMRPPTGVERRFSPSDVPDATFVAPDFVKECKSLAASELEIQERAFLLQQQDGPHQHERERVGV